MKRRKTDIIRAGKRTCKAVANFGSGISHSNSDFIITAKTIDDFPSLYTSGKQDLNASIGRGSTRIHLHGKTVANYDNGTGTTKNLKYTKAKDCTSCPDKDCITVSGILALTFMAHPGITLPSPSKYAHLRPCQRKRVKVWIKNVLLPHEKQHKAAFEKYNGTVNKPFKMKICKEEWNADLLQPIHEKEDQRRKKIANDASDALDPFITNIDLDCEDKKASTDEKSYYPLTNS